MRESEKGGWAAESMKRQRILLLSLVIVVIAFFEAVAIFSKPKFAFTRVGDGSQSEVVPLALGVGDSSQGGETSLLRELSPTAVEPEQAMNLELIGTAMGSIKDPIAFIKDLETGAQGIYKQGSRIRDAKVVRIVMGQVTLDVSGKQQVLKISERGRRVAHLDEKRPAVVSLSDNEYVVNKQELMKQPEEVIKSIRQVKINPYYENQKVAGLKVEGVPANSIFSAAGIRESDIVTMINAQQIDSYQKALQVMQKAKGLPEIKVSVLRSGKTKMLSYRMQ